MKDESGSLIEWILPLAFFLCFGWVIWHIPGFIIDIFPPADESLQAQISGLHLAKDAAPWGPALFGGLSDIIDWAALIALPILAYFGIKTIVRAPMEYDKGRAIDKFSVFIGRVTMMMILSMTLIMLYEVFLRYVVEAPTLWANEMTLWIAGFVFLLSGLYAMQQRCHIRIFLLYDLVPRWLQHVFDVISVALLCIFAIGLVFGSYYQVFYVKFYRWEMFGTAFDPPIPATIQPTILIIISLIAIQSVINLISDWHLEPETHSAADDIDQQELEALKKSVGAD